MSEGNMGWEIPSGLNELFDNVPAQYSIIDSDYSGDNVYAMNLFVDSIEGLGSCIIIDDGTQVVAERNGKKIVIDSGGLGDFDRHGYDVTEYKAK
jgi:hypothetical protein